jgi:iron(III) transport system permease protein
MAVFAFDTMNACGGGNHLPLLRRPFRAAPLWAVLVACAAAAMVLVPLTSLMIIAAKGTANVWHGLTLYVLPHALLETTLLLGGVALLAGSMGLGAAWLVTVYRFPGRSMLAWLLPLPLACPAYIMAYIYVEIFDAAGPVQSWLRMVLSYASPHDYWFPSIRSLPGCILVMSLVLYPYVYLTARMMFLTQSAALIEAARTLGANRLTLFRLVALPLARPALAIGLSFVLLEALNDIGASEYLGVRTLTVSVYTTWLNRGSLAGAAQIACLMLLIVIGLISLEQRGRRLKHYQISARNSRVVQPVLLGGKAGFFACLVCALPILGGFVLPCGFLLREVLRQGLPSFFEAPFLVHLSTTFTLAAFAAVITMGLGLIVVTAARFARHRLTSWSSAIVGLGYAVPGTVLALGLLAPLNNIDSFVQRALTVIGLDAYRFFLTGSVMVLVIVYMIRFLPISTGALQAGLKRVSPMIDDAARVLGASSRAIVLKVQLPLLKPALASAALLVFIDCLKELPATLLLRPLNVETLATLVYGHASRGAFEEGAFAALMIILVSLWPVLRLSRT